MSRDFRSFDVITPAQQIERWEQCLRVLRSLSRHDREKHWDMQTFGCKTSCGTIACAAGHCGLDPWFRRRGFQLNFVSYPDLMGPSELYWDFNISSVERFFGDEGSDKIFYNYGRRSVGQVIREVRAHIKLLRTTRPSLKARK